MNVSNFQTVTIKVLDFTKSKVYLKKSRYFQLQSTIHRQGLYETSQIESASNEIIEKKSDDNGGAFQKRSKPLFFSTVDGAQN